jgi:hypothetical protein
MQAIELLKRILKHYSIDTSGEKFKEAGNLSGKKLWQGGRL